MNSCIYCGHESDDDDFCESCGKAFSCNKPEDTQSLKDYTDSDLLFTIKFSTLTGEDNFYSKTGLIKEPILIKSKLEPTEGNLNKLYFSTEINEIQLLKYIEENGLTKEDLSTIIFKMYRIIKEVQDEGLALGSIDIEDLWLEDGTIESLHLKQTKKLLKTYSDLNGHIQGEISGISGNYDIDDVVDKRCDVMLLGRLYLALATNLKFDIENYFQERYIAYNLDHFSDINNKELHTWLSKTINIDIEQRYSTIEECIDDFDLLQLPRNLKNMDESLLDIEISYSTHTGIGKEIKMKGVNPLERNEDSFLVKESIHEYEYNYKRNILLLVADGVSTCSIGSGYKASRIVRDTASQLWEECNENLSTKEDVETFFNNVVKLSNKRIWEYSFEEAGDEALKKTIMASTISIAAIIDNNMYYTSIGDSPMYIFTNEYVIPLTTEDNRGNQLLSEGCSWDKFNNTDTASSLTRCIGGIHCLPNNIDKQGVEVSELELLDNEMILICSDGLTDYVGIKSSLDEQWQVEEKLKSIILEDDDLDNTVNKLIDLANTNGGGDNITIILAKANII